MIDFILYILLICIYNSILFFNKRLGLNVILFIIPLLLLIYYILNKNKKIKNKKGLLFSIPITLLSASYFIYDNNFFKVFNVIVIPILFALMYTFSMKETIKISELIKNIFRVILCPFSHIGNCYKVLGEKLSKILKISDNSKKKLKSLLIVIPITIIVLLLLTSADMIFSNIFSDIFKITDKFSIDNIVGRVINITILFTYLGSTISYLLLDFSKDNTKDKREFKIEDYTIKLLLTTLNVIYIIFDFIQIRSLIFHQGLSNINYAEYARSGFFQLMFISVINITILLISKKTTKDTKYNKTMSIIMIGLTLIIIISSFLRMNMYESAYGYTLLRLLVYVSLITEVILLIPTFIYVINPKINILKYYVIIITVVYTMLSLSPVDYFIARNNINRYYKTNKIDIDYLQNYSTDNISLLYKFYNDISEKEKDDNNYTMKVQLKHYFFEIYNNNKNDSLLEYNISRDKATNLLKDISKEVYDE